MGVRYTSSWAPSSCLFKRLGVVVLSILWGDVQALLPFTVSSAEGNVKKNFTSFYSIFHPFTPFVTGRQGGMVGPFPTLPSYYVPCFAKNQSINLLAMLIFPGIRGRLSTENQPASSISASSMVISPPAYVAVNPIMRE